MIKLMQQLQAFEQSLDFGQHGVFEEIGHELHTCERLIVWVVCSYAWTLIGAEISPNMQNVNNTNL